MFLRPFWCSKKAFCNRFWQEKDWTENLEAIWTISFKIRVKIEIQECLSLSRQVCFRCKFCVWEMHFSSLVWLFTIKNLNVSLNSCYTDAKPQWTWHFPANGSIKTCFSSVHWSRVEFAAKLAGFFSIFVTKKMLCNTHVKIKYDNEAKKGNTKERKKEVGALMAGHSRLVTQPVLNPADRA